MTATLILVIELDKTPMRPSARSCYSGGLMLPALVRSDHGSPEMSRTAADNTLRTSGGPTRPFDGTAQHWPTGDSDRYQ